MLTHILTVTSGWTIKRSIASVLLAFCAHNLGHYITGVALMIHSFCRLRFSPYLLWIIHISIGRFLLPALLPHYTYKSPGITVAVRSDNFPHFLLQGNILAPHYLTKLPRSFKCSLRDRTTCKYHTHKCLPH